MCRSVSVRSVWRTLSIALTLLAVSGRAADMPRIMVTDPTGGGMDAADVRLDLIRFIGVQHERWAPVLPPALDITVTADPGAHIGGATPDWGAGFALPDRNRIIIVNEPRRNLPRFGLQETMRHETVHILFHQVTGDRPVPRWFEEGFAMTAAGEWRFGYDIAIARARLTGSLLPLDGIDRVLRFPDARAQLAYAQSFAAFRMLVRQAGMDRVYAMIADIGTRGFADAFIRAAGMGAAEFENRYREELARRYGPRRLLLDGSLYWLGLTGLFLAVYLINRARTRKKLRQWEEEEMKRLCVT